MLTVKKHLDLMKHALGKTPDSRHLLLDTFNRAGGALYVEHPWSWRHASPVVLDVPASSQQALLPMDFGQMVNVQSTNTNVFRVYPTTMSQIMLLRSDQVYDANSLWIAFRVNGGQPTTTSYGNQQPVAEIFPTQATARTDIKLHYLTRWVDFDDETLDANDVPPIPAEFEHALTLWARKFAAEVENREQGVAVETQMLREELDRLKNYDGSLQVNMGQPRHSVGSYAVGAGRPFSRIGPKT